MRGIIAIVALNHKMRFAIVVSECCLLLVHLDISLLNCLAYPVICNYHSAGQMLGVGSGSDR